MSNRAINFFILGLLSLLAGPIFTNTVAAQSPSLWQRRDHRRTNMIADVKARRVGDLLSIVVNEQSDVQNRDQRLMNKDSSASGEISANYGVGGGLGSGTGTLSGDFDTSSSRDMSGNAQYRSEREFLDRFTVMVVDTLPNGNLVVGGTRNVSLEGDNRKLILTGIVRRADVQRDNSISSRMVYNLSLRYETVEGQGAERKFINQGWLGKKLNKAWPF